MSIHRLYQTRQTLFPITRRFDWAYLKPIQSVGRHAPYGLTTPPPNFSTATSTSTASKIPVEHSAVSKLLAPGYEIDGHLKKIPKTLEVFDENGLMRWGTVGIPLAMVTGMLKPRAFTHRL